MAEDDTALSKLSSFIKGSSILVLSNVCLKAINFFLLPLYTSNLTPSMLGVSDSISTATSFLLPLLTLGLDSAYSAFYFEASDESRSLRVYSTLVVAFAFQGLLPLIGIPFARQFSILLFGNENYTSIVRVSLAGLSLNLWYMPYSLELRLQNEMSLFGLTNVLASLSMVCLNVLFVSILHLGEFSLILSTLLVNLEQLLFLQVVVRTHPKRDYVDFGLLNKMVRFALPLVPTAVMTWVLSLSDRYILLHYIGSDAVGLYGIGLRFTTVLNVIVSAVSMAYTTFAFSSRDDEGSKVYYRYIFQAESIILIVVSFTIAIFGREIVGVMVSSNYANAVRCLRDLMFAQSVYAMTTVVGYGIYFEKKSIYSFFAVAGGALLNISLNLLLIPKYGITAAAFTTLAGYLLDFIITYYYSERFFPCDYGLRIVGSISIILYLLSLVFVSSPFAIRVLIWLISSASILYTYRTPIRHIIAYLKEHIRK